MDEFHTLVVLFFTIVITNWTPWGWGHTLPHLGSLTTHLLAQLIGLLLQLFRYAKTPRRCPSSHGTESHILPYKI